jgi:hypothetical protein
MPLSPIVLVDAEAAGVVGRALADDPPMREVEERIPADIPEEGPADEELELVETTAPAAALVLPVVGDDVLPLLPLPPPAPLPELRPPRSLVVKLEPSLVPCWPRPPRNWGVRSDEYFSGPVCPVRSSVCSRRPPPCTVNVRIPTEATCVCRSTFCMCRQ